MMRKTAVAILVSGCVLFQMPLALPLGHEAAFAEVVLDASMGSPGAMDGPFLCRVGPLHPDACSTGNHTFNETLSHGFAAGPTELFTGTVMSRIDWHSGARVFNCSMVLATPTECSSSGEWPSPGTEFQHHCVTEALSIAEIMCLVTYT